MYKSSIVVKPIIQPSFTKIAMYAVPMPVASKIVSNNPPPQQLNSAKKDGRETKKSLEVFA